MSVYAVNGKEPSAVWIPSLDTAGNGTTTLTDLVGSRTGTLTNFALTGSTSNWVSDTNAGGIRALDFDGTDDYVVTSSGLSITSTSFSVSLWVYRVFNAAIYPRFIDISDGTNSFQIISDDSGAGSGEISTKHTQFQTGFTSTKWGVLTTATWTHFLVSVDSSAGTVSLWKNGVAVTGSAGNAVGARAAANNIVLGQRRDVPSITTLQGRLDDVRLFPQSTDLSDAAYLHHSGAGRGRVSVSLDSRRRRQSVSGGVL